MTFSMVLSMAGERTRFEEFAIQRTEPGSQSNFTAVTNVNVISRTQNSSSQVGFCTVTFKVALWPLNLADLVGGGELVIDILLTYNSLIY